MKNNSNKHHFNSFNYADWMPIPANKKIDVFKTLVVGVSNPSKHGSGIKALVRQKRLISESRKKECRALKFFSTYLEDIVEVSNSVSRVIRPYLGISFSGGVSLAAPVAKMGMDLAYVDNECDLIPFEELNEILKIKFYQTDVKLDRNYNTIRENLQQIHKNYQAINRAEGKIDRNLIAVQLGFALVSEQIGKTGNQMKEGFEKIRAFVRQSRIEDVTSKLITFIEYFMIEKSALKYLSTKEIITKFNEKDSILSELKKVRSPNSTNSLHTLLNNIINQRFAIPESDDDKTAFAALYFLCMGTEIYVSVLSFLLKGYSALAENSYQKNDIAAYNNYFSISVMTLKDFTNSLTGVNPREGLIDKVINTLYRVKGLIFFRNKKNKITEFIEKKIDSFKQIKSQFMGINNLPNNKVSELIRYNFTDSAIKTPLLEWRSGKKVSYAVQYMNKGIYSQVSDWSVPYTITTKACPKLNIGTAPQGVTRFIFRRFDSEKPELVGNIVNSNQTEFRDIHRDLYNAVLEANEEIALWNIATLIDDGAKANFFFEKGRQAIHAAAQTGNIKTILNLVEKGSDINAQDANGYTVLHVAAELGYEHLVTGLINHSSNINITTYAGWTALHLAAEKNHIGVIEIFLQTDGIDINARTAGGFTPLHVAVSANAREAIFKLSSDIRSDVNAQSEKSLSPLHCAVLADAEQEAKILLSNNKTDINLSAQGNLTALHFASLTGNEKVIERLLAADAVKIDARSENDWTALHLSVSLKKQSVVEKLLSTGKPDINAEGKDKLTPLHLAVRTEQRSITLILLDMGAKLEVRDAYYYTPLHLAAEKGLLKMVKLLFERGAALNTTQQSGDSPLSLAVASGQVKVVNFLVDQGASIDIKNKAGRSPLDIAALTGYLDIVKILIEKSPNSKEDVTHCAISGDQPEIVRYLVDVAKINITIQDPRGKTFVHLAAESGSTRIVQYLNEIEQANFTANDNMGKMPLHLAVENGHLETTNYILDSTGANIHIKDNQGKTPLHLAAKRGHLSVLEKLLKQGADVDVNTKDNFGETALHLAAKNGYLPLTEKLISGGADVKLTNKLGKTALHLAAKNGHFSVVEKLLENGVSVDAIDIFDETALLLGAKNGHLSVVEKLLESGASVDSKNKAGETPLYVAYKNGYMFIVKQLLENGANADALGVTGAPWNTVTHYNQSATADNTGLQGARAHRHGITSQDLLQEIDSVNPMTFFSLKNSTPSSPFILSGQNTNQNNKTAPLNRNMVNDSSFQSLLIGADNVFRKITGTKYPFRIAPFSKSDLLNERLSNTAVKFARSLNYARKFSAKDKVPAMPVELFYKHG